MGHRSVRERWTRWSPIFFGLVLADCAQPAVSPRGELTKQLATRTAGPPQACVLAQSDRNLVATDPATIVYDTGSAIYVNRLAGSCPGLRELSTIVVLSSAGGQYCRGDRFRAREQGSTVPEPACLLGEWVPYRR
jgi:hypothetical protein